MLDYVFSDTRSLPSKDMLTSSVLFLLDKLHTAYMLLFLDVYLAFGGMFYSWYHLLLYPDDLSYFFWYHVHSDSLEMFYTFSAFSDVTSNL